jgi:leucyl-tRNA synthetase
VERKKGLASLVLFLFSGAGLHVGHPEGYTATDILARYKARRYFSFYFNHR